MRYILFFLLLFHWQPVEAQDKQLLKKQLFQLMMAYPDKFRSIKQDGSYYKFSFTGADRYPMKQLRSDTTTVSMAIMLPGVETETEANAVFDKWTALLNEIDFSGATTKAASCAGGYLVSRCRVWKLDTETQFIDKKYRNFSITLEGKKIGKTYFTTITIGDE